MVSLSAARQCIIDHLQPLPPVVVPLAEAMGRVLAAPVVADGWYPDGDRSQMDGYVVRADARPGRFRLAGEIPAGMAPRLPVGEGECWRIFTGALLPEGGGRVIMQEEARREGEEVVLEQFGGNRFVRVRGSEARPGDVLMEKGTLLGPAELAVLAQTGSVNPWVIPVPSVRQVSTGGELVDPSEVPAEGFIRDTNSTLLRALFGGMGVADFSSARVADDPAAILRAADGPEDLLILSGGASAGDYDFGARVLRELGYAIHFDRVNLRPGKPLTFATRGRQAAFVLPGNPVSHYVCFQTAVRLAVECAGGHRPSWPAVWVELAEGAEALPDPRETWWPARSRIRDGRLTVSLKKWSSSGNTFSLAGTNALVLVNATSPHQGRALTLLLEPPVPEISGHA